MKFSRPVGRAIVLLCVLAGSTLVTGQEDHLNPHTEALFQAIHTDQTARIIEEAERLESRGNFPGLYGALSEVSRYFSRNNAFEMALEYQLRALRYMGNMSGYEGKINKLFAFGNVSILYEKIDRDQMARNYLDSAYRYARQSGYPFFLLHAHNNLGMYYTRKNEPDSALRYFINAQRYLRRSRGDSLMNACIAGNMGRIYAEKEDPTRARDGFEANLAISRRINEIDYYPTACEYILYLLEWGDTARARLLLREVETPIRKQYPELASWYQQALLTWAVQTNAPQSGRILRRYLHLNDSLLAARSTQLNKVVGEAMGKRLALQQKKAELQQAESMQLSKQKTIRIQQLLLLILSLIAVLVILVILYKKRVRAKQEQVRAEKLRSALAEKELENESLKRKQLDIELQFKSRDITNLAIDIHEKSALHTIWARKLERLLSLKDFETVKKEMKTMLRDVHTSERIDRQKRPLKEKVEEVNAAFYAKLAEEFPSLTKNDREICGMIRMRMSTKEIATLKNITPGSAKVMKTRIRKKLELDPGDDLQLFISQV